MDCYVCGERAIVRGDENDHARKTSTLEAGHAGHLQLDRVRSRSKRKEGVVNHPPAEPTDEALILRYQRGDRSAFAELVRRHQKPLYNFVLRRLGSPGAAEDLTQETFVRIVKNASDFKHEARFSTWLYTIARNLCVDHARKMKHRAHPSLDGPEPGSGNRSLGERLADVHPTSSVQRAVMGSLVRDEIVRAVEALPDEQREVFLLREIADLPFREIAEIAGTNENTVKSRMRYALERLREALSDFEEYARALR